MLNGFAKGYSGVSADLVRLILQRIEQNSFPKIDASGTVGASDLVPLAQLSDWILSSTAAIELGLPRPKEALSMMNSNAITLSLGVNRLAELKRLTQIQELVAAVTMKGFRCNLNAIHWQVNEVHCRGGQKQVASRLRAYLQGSKLWEFEEARYTQDPLSFRCITQVHGAMDELLKNAELVLSEELNSLDDNPIVDQASLLARSHGNMDTTRYTLMVDQLRQAVAKLADLSGERIQKLQWPAFSNLPIGLSSEHSPMGGVQFLNLGHIAASLVTSIKIWAQPHLLISVGQLADGVEDTAGNASHTVHDLERQIEAGWTLAAN